MGKKMGPGGTLQVYAADAACAEAGNCRRGLAHLSGPAKACFLLRPMARLQRIEPHRATGRGRMYETPLADVDAGMGGLAAAKQHQVAGASAPCSTGWPKPLSCATVRGGRRPARWV